MRPSPHRRRRGAAGGVPRPADRAELRPAGHVHAARQQRPRGRGEDVHAAAAGRREHRPRRSSSRPSPPASTSSCTSAPSATGIGGCARSSRCPAGSRAASSRPPTSSPRATAGWSAPTATRRTPSGSRAPASTSPRCSQPDGASDAESVGALSGCCSGSGCCWSGAAVRGRRSRAPTRAGRAARQELLAAGRADRHQRRAAGRAAGRPSALLVLVVVLLTTGTVDDQPGVRGVRLRSCRSRRCAGCAAQRHGRPARGVAGGRRQPGLRRPGRAVAAGGAVARSAIRGPEVLRRRSPGSPRTTARPAGSATCLDRLKDDLADPVGDRIVETLRVAREVGGTDLGRVLRTLSHVPARGRPHPRRAGDPAGLGGQGRAAGASPRPGSCCCCSPPSRRRSTPTTPPAGARRAARRRRRSAASPTGVMLRIGRLPEDERVLR